MDPTTITSSTFTLTGPGGAVAAAVAYNGTSNVATLTPSASFAPSTTYTAQLSAAVRASDGTPLGSAVSWSFTTAAPDTTPPGPVTSFTATLGASSVALAWTNSSDADFDHVRVVRKTGSAPTSPTDGTVVCDCTGQTATDARPPEQTTYNYAAYAFDRTGNASTPAAAQVTAPVALDVYTSFVTDSGCTACSAGLVGSELRAAIGGAANTVDTAYGQRDFGGASGLTGRVYHRTSVRLAAGQTLASNLWLFAVRDAANNVVFEIYLTSARVIRLSSPAGGLRSTSISQSTGITLPNDGVTSRSIEVSALANGSVEVRVDGVTKINITGLIGATTGNQRYLRAGIDRYDGTSTAPVQIFHSRVSVSQASWLGP
jgi:hypothetical protein